MIRPYQFVVEHRKVIEDTPLAFYDTIDSPNLGQDFFKLSRNIAIGDVPPSLLLEGAAYELAKHYYESPTYMDSNAPMEVFNLTVEQARQYGFNDELLFKKFGPIFLLTGEGSRKLNPSHGVIREARIKHLSNRAEIHFFRLCDDPDYGEDKKDIFVR